MRQFTLVNTFSSKLVSKLIELKHQLYIQAWLTACLSFVWIKTCLLCKFLLTVINIGLTILTFGHAHRWGSAPILVALT